MFVADSGCGHRPLATLSQPLPSRELAAQEPAAQPLTFDRGVTCSGL